MNTVYKYQPETGFDTPELCHIVELYNTENDSACSVAQASVKLGDTTQLHFLKGISERYVILQGEGLVEVDEVKSSVTTMDVISIPPGVGQRITNTGAIDLVFLCICTPRFQNKCYVAS